MASSPPPAAPPRRLARVAAAAVAGLMLALGVPETDAWFLGFVAWLPWLWAIEGQRPRAAFLYGLCTGVVFIVLAYWWMTELLMRFAEFPLPVAIVVHIIFSFWQGSIAALAALLVSVVRRRAGVGLLWLAPAAWVAVEAFMPALFPTYMAIMWAWQPRLIQLAELGGVTMVTFAMVAINAALYTVITTAIRERRVHRSAAIHLVAWLVLVPTYGTIRMGQVDAQTRAVESVRFGVVQGNFGINTYKDEDYLAQILAEMQRVTTELEAEGAQIAVWGETAYPMTAINRARDEDFELDDDYRIRRGFSIPVIFGSVTYDSDVEYTWNSALVLEADGSIGKPYDKVYPLLFGEAAPSFVDPSWYLQTIPNASHLNRGTGPAVLTAAGYRFGPLICYEDILPRYVHEVATQDVHALVNVTNDSWFGRTHEQAEHLALAVFRAVEHRRGLIRSVNAGMSAYVDPAGRVVERTGVTDSDVDGYDAAEGFTADVPMMAPESRTVFARTGQAFNLGALLLVIGLGARRRVRDK